ncbi:MAG: serine hydrolase [Dysgonamonadaceae bacterium]|jgi:beta-glucosidase-like glycosyl hydrolase/CubicO group peptidase (beta-lactamase class C family)|nr:serine hydrolase [Dysgonamonadaceae bacterium]
MMKIFQRRKQLVYSGKKLVCSSLFLIIPFIAHGQIHPNLFKDADKKEMQHWVDSIFDSMSLDEKIGQLFMVVADPQSTYHNRIIKNIREQKIGGILFSGGKLDDQAASINLYQQHARVPLFISFDGEWGLAMRLEDDTPRFPKNMMLGAIQDNNWIQLYGEEMARECKELGVQINFAPVLDVNVNPNNPVINLRSFGENPDGVAEKGIAYSMGLEKGNVISVGKHFPGHGDTSKDSHHTLPLINHGRERLDSIELYPFKQYINAGLAGIMTGHLAIPALDHSTGLPSSLSPVIVTELLTEDLGFQGLKVTDALVMRGASGGKRSVCVESILAGNDILLSPEKPITEFAAVKNAVQSGVIPMELIEEKCIKILRYKYITGLNHYKPIETKELKERINSIYADWLIQKLNAEAITLLKNEDMSIPLKQLGEKKIAVVALGEQKKNEFQETMNFYDSFDFFRLGLEENAAALFSKLQNYDAIVVSIHSNKVPDYQALQALSKNKEVHLCFFLSPYQLKKYQESIKSAQSVTLAYENTQYAQKTAAEVIMGGLPAKGKLPVTISGLFEYGTGIETQKVRLSYQHPMEVGMSEQTLKKIDYIVREGIKEKAFPGCQVFVAKNQVVVYNKSFGYFDYARTHQVQTSDVYDLASITKATATVSGVMKLYDKKKITLDDKLSKFIPQLRNTDKANITVRMALSHESRLPSFYPFYQLLIDQNSYEGRLFSNKRDLTYSILYDKDTYMRSDFEYLPDKVSQTPKKGISKQVAENFYIADNFNDEMIKKISELNLRKKSTYLYSDLNFILLKEMIENVSGESFDKFSNRNFFANLGASTTTFLPLKKIDKNTIAPTEHDEFFRNQILIGFPHDEAAAVQGGVSGNAGLFSNANDLAKLLQMFLNDGEYGGERYISKETALLFTQTKSNRSRRGLAFDKPDKKKEVGTTSERASAETYGHTGYTGTCFWVDPKENLIFIFLSNRIYPSRTHTQLMELKIRPRIHDIIYESIN